MRRDESPLHAFYSRTDVAPSSVFLTKLKLQCLSLLLKQRFVVQSAF